jgi:hypothetical protein
MELRLLPDETGTVCLQNHVDDVLSKGATTVVVPPGRYRIRPGAPKQPHLHLNKVKNLHIQADGVTFICTELATFLSLYRCHDVRLTGATIDYDPLPLTQGTIVGIAQNRRWTDVRIHKGYPEPNLHLRPKKKARSHYYIYEPVTRKLKIGCKNRAVVDIENRGKGIWRLHHAVSVRDTAAPGDLIRIPRKYTRPHGMSFVSCEGLHFENVTLLAAPGFGVTDKAGSGSVYERFRIIPGPPPPGATEPRLFSSMYDGLNGLAGRSCPIVRNGAFAYTGDDAIAWYINPLLVLSIPEPGRAHLALKNDATTCRPGDQLRFPIHGADTAVTVTVASVKRVLTEKKQLRNQVLALLPDYRGNTFNGVLEVTFRKPVSLPPGATGINLAQAGHGFRIENNRVFNSASRGIVCNLAGGSLRNNRIDTTFLCGIHVFEATREGGPGFVEDLAIAGNEVSWSCVNQPPNAGWSGGITVTTWSKDYTGSNGHRDLRILDNSVHHTVGPALQVHCAADVLIRGNRFQHTHQAPAAVTTKYRDINNGATVVLDDVRNVRLEDNTISDPGPYADCGEPLQVLRARGVQGGLSLPTPAKP